MSERVVVWKPSGRAQRRYWVTATDPWGNGPYFLAEHNNPWEAKLSFWRIRAELLGWEVRLLRAQPVP